MATRLTVHVRHMNKDKMFYKTEPVKTYYYKKDGQEKLIGNEEVYQKLHQDELRNKKVFTKMTKARRRIRTTHTFIIDSMTKDIVKQHVKSILSKLKSQGYKYTWKRPDKGGAIVDHWYLSNCYTCN